MADMTQGKTALITGASGGIGFDFGPLFAQDGYNLVLVARSEDALNRQAAELCGRYGIAVKVIAKDLARPEAPQEIFDELEAAGIKIEALVNNAGFATYGHFSDLDLQNELNMMQVNMVALTHLTRLFLPGMKERDRGKILNVASTAAFQPGPLMAVYYATKAYVLSFSEALANELAGSGVTVTVLCPGPTQTGFQQRAAMEDSRLVSGRRLLSSAEVARAGYEAMQKGKTLIVPGLKNAVMAQSYRFAPRKLATRLVRGMQERTH